MYLFYSKSTIIYSYDWLKEVQDNSYLMFVLIVKLFEIEDAFNFLNFLFTTFCIFALDSKVAMGYYL